MPKGRLARTRPTLPADYQFGDAMGWAARANPRLNEQRRMARLRELCERMPRDVVEEAMQSMSQADQAIVLKMLNAVQPVTTH